MEPLLVQHHIAKTAGTSLRQVTRANYAPHQVADIERLFGAKPAPRDYRWEDAVAGSRRAYEAVDPARRAEIRCLIGHSAPILLSIVEDRDLTLFTLLRDPAERVTSLLQHGRRQADAPGASTGPAAARAVWAPMIRTMRERGLDLSGAYRAVGDTEPDPELAWLFRPLFNEQASQILMSVMDPREVPMTSDRGALEPYLERALVVLSRSYVVGTQERFSQSVRLFAERFGWRNAFIPRRNVSDRRLEPDAEARSLVEAYNWLDRELHRRYSEDLARLPPVSRATRARGAVVHRARGRFGRVRRALRGA